MFGVSFEIVQFALKLALVRVVLQPGKNGRVDLIGRVVQGAGINSRGRSIGIGKLLRYRRKSGNGRAYGIDLAPAQSIAFIHAIHSDGTGVAVEEKLVFAAGTEPVVVIFPIATRFDAESTPLIQVILECQGFQCTIGDGRVVRDVLIRSLNGELASMFHKIIGA